MIFLMLVMVFSTLSRKWWFFLLLGYGRLFKMGPLSVSEIWISSNAVPVHGECALRVNLLCIIWRMCRNVECRNYIQCSVWIKL